MLKYAVLTREGIGLNCSRERQSDWWDQSKHYHARLNTISTTDKIPSAVDLLRLCKAQTTKPP